MQAEYLKDNGYGILFYKKIVEIKIKQKRKVFIYNTNKLTKKIVDHYKEILKANNIIMTQLQVAELLFNSNKNCYRCVDCINCENCFKSKNLLNCKNCFETCNMQNTNDNYL